MTPKLGSYNVVTVRYILSGIKMRLGLRDTSTDDLLLKDLIVEGIKRMRLPNLFIRAIAFLPIENKRAELPEDFVRFDKQFPIRFVDDNGQQTTQNGAPIYIDNTFFTSDPNANKDVFFPSTVTHNGQYLYFSSDVDATRCEISYLSVNYDCNGDLVITQDMESPLISYVMWQYGLMNPDKMPQWVCANWERQYKINRKAVKGLEKLPDGLELSLVNFRMNTLP